MPTPKKVNGFQIFMNDIRRNLPADQRSSLTQQELVQLCDPLWKALSEEQKKVYTDRAKAKNENRKCQDLSISIDQFRSKHNIQAPETELRGGIPRQQFKGLVKIQPIRKDHVDTFINACKQMAMSEETSLWNRMSLMEFSNTQSFVFIDVQCFTDIPLVDSNHSQYLKNFVAKTLTSSPSADAPFIELNKIFCIPAEITIAKYSVKEGLVSCYHDFINCGNSALSHLFKFLRENSIPLGYAYHAKNSSDSTHHIPMEGLSRETPTSVMASIISIYCHLLGGTIYCRRAHWNHVVESLEWLRYKTKMFSGFNRVLDVETLFSRISNIMGVKATSCGGVPVKSQPEDVSCYLNSTHFNYNPDIRCPFHKEENTYHCSMKNVLSYMNFLGEILCNNFGLPPKLHFPTSLDALARPFTNVTNYVFSPELQNRGPAFLEFSTFDEPTFNGHEQDDEENRDSDDNFQIFKY